MRADGRYPLDKLPVTLTFPSVPGFCIASNTFSSVSAHAQLSQTTPHANKPSCGFLRIIGSSQLQMSFQQTNLVPLESLCVKTGQIVNQLTVTVNVLKQDGSVFGLQMSAACAAIQHLGIPIRCIPASSEFSLQEEYVCDYLEEERGESVLQSVVDGSGQLLFFSQEGKVSGNKLMECLQNVNLQKGSGKLLEEAVKTELEKRRIDNREEYKKAIRE
ncbi:3'_exoribonuclease family protein [Hexamita inflata]|uniref:3'_exoribonuclease family protein n=1 Tax=Hexamita inflata TaxID=28002 RepID=A0ABP1JFK1_9EUKA